MHLWVLQEGSLLYAGTKITSFQRNASYGYVFIITESRLMITTLIETKLVTLLLSQAVVLLNTHFLRSSVLFRLFLIQRSYHRTEPAIVLL